MNRRLLPLLLVTAITGFAQITNADNSNKFKVIDPTKTTDVRVTQKGDLNTTAGSIAGSGNAFRITQTGTRNYTSIDMLYDTTMVKNSNLTQIINGSYNFLITQFGESNSDSYSHSYSNYKLQTKVTGDANQAFTTVAGNDSTVAETINGNYSSIDLTLNGDNVAAGVRIEGNKNSFVGSTSSTSSVKGFSNSKLSVNIKGSGNTVDNGKLTDYDLVRETIIGSDNKVEIDQGPAEAISANYTNDKLIVSITGNSNTIEGLQQGSNDQVSATLNGSHDTITFTQLGDGDTITASITDTVGIASSNNNTLHAHQEGDGNKMTLAINGMAGSVNGNQSGNNNKMLLSANGLNNAMDGKQTGDGNAMSVKFVGDNNSFKGTQTGNGLSYRYSSTASNQVVKVDQHN